MNRLLCRSSCLRLPAVIAACLLAVNPGWSAAAGEPPPRRIQNVIFMIGDGMGLAQVAACRIKTCGSDGRLAIETLPVTGLSCTHSANRLITDSGAGGTALSTGMKTNNYMIGVNPEGDVLTTILEACRDEGMATGIVVTSSITHATPATFTAHVADRDSECLIAAQQLEAGIDILMGGGAAFFLPASDSLSDRTDRRNLVKEAGKRGYEVVRTRAALCRTKANRILGLFNVHELTGKDTLEPGLAEMTADAIDRLRNDPEGFFLMVEGSQIDWACHDNDEPGMISQVAQFDSAVAIALEYVSADTMTLLIVTADHETGGCAVNGGLRNGDSLAVGWTSTNHTGEPVPVYAAGRGAQEFTGTHDNTEIPRIIARLLGISDFPRVVKGD